VDPPQGMRTDHRHLRSGRTGRMRPVADASLGAIGAADRVPTTTMFFSAHHTKACARSVRAWTPASRRSDGGCRTHRCYSICLQAGGFR
jgi:hypothetical protein